MKGRIYDALTNPRPGDWFGRVVSLILLVLIAANVTASVLETDARIAAAAPRFFYWFERVSIVVFTVEYLVRLWACTADPKFSAPFSGRLRMALRPMSVVDFLAIAPFYVELLMAGFLDLRFLRALRVLRIFRLLRMRRISDAFGTIMRVLQGKRVEIGVTLAFVIVAMLLSAGAMYVVEHQEPNTLFTSIPKAMWWAIVTITTIGYGDMVPVTAIGKFIGGVVGFIGICAVALPVGILSSGFIDELNRRKAEQSASGAACPHCGNTI